MNDTATRHKVHDFLTGRSWIVALAIAVLGFFLRIPGVFDWWVNPDEGIYYSMLTWEDSSRFWAEFSANAHPPLYYLVLRLLAGLTTEFGWFRMIAVTAGAVAIFGAYLFTRQAVGEGSRGAIAGLLAALLLAVSPGAILLSQLIRPYMLQLALVTLAYYFLLRLLQAGGRRHILGYSVFMSLAVLTHYSSFLILGGVLIVLGVAFLARRLPARTFRWSVLGNAAPVLLVILLYFLHMRPRMIGSTMEAAAMQGWLRPYLLDTPGQAWQLLVAVFALTAKEQWEPGDPVQTAGQLDLWNFAGQAAILFLLGLLVATWQRKLYVFGLATATLALAIAASALHRYPFGCSRHSMYLVPVLLLPIAWLAAWIATQRRPIRVAGAVLLAGLMLWGGNCARALGVPPATLHLLPERLALAEHLEAVRPVIENELRTEGAVLLGEQTYYLLMPYYLKEREAIEERGGIRRFRWGKRDVVVARGWAFDVDPKKLDRSNHLYREVRAADDQFPDLRLSERANVLMLFGGWEQSAPNYLGQVDARLPSNEKLIHAMMSSPGMIAFRFHLARFMRVMQSFLDRR